MVESTHWSSLYAAQFVLTYMQKVSCREVTINAKS